MIGHDYCGVQIVANGVIMANRLEHHVARPFRQGPSIFGDERDKVPLTISLQMRQVAPVKRHTSGLSSFETGDHEPRRADAFVRPAERSSTEVCCYPCRY